MRSIRRSLLGYLLVLLALALGAVGVLVDRFANAAVRAREASESDRIEQAFGVRRQEAMTKFDADLMAETKSLALAVPYKVANVLGQHHDPRRGPPKAPEPPVKAPDEEGRAYRTRVALLEFATPTTVLPALATAFALEPRIDPRAAGDPRRSSPFPGWVEYDAPRMVARLQESVRKAFDDDDHPGYIQFTLVASYLNRPNRTVMVARPAQVGPSTRFPSDLSLDASWLDQSADAEPRFDDLDVPEKGKFRRVVTGTTSTGRPLVFFVVLPSPPAPAPAPPRYPSYPPFNRADVVVRVFVHYARPYSELDAQLVADQTERDAQLARVGEETRAELTQLRRRLWLIGAGTFAALVLGGWYFVARGLSPLRTLSDAVSRVSEKDFRLPVVAGDLGRELLPIHARISQTLTLLQRAFEREKQSVADISHELRTPIASLLATIDVALRKPRTPEQYRTTLEECRLISKQLGQLVERIMTLASLDAGNDHTHIARTDAGELALGCAAVIRPLAAANNLSVGVHVADEVTLETDPGKLREVLMNLLHNAVEYNQPGGTIELTVRRAGATAVFEVRDTGIGMTADVKERIFERFYRADSSRHATGVHAGLGLAIVKEYVARLNGTIVVESEPGVGTTFRVTLPAPAGEPLPTAPRAKSGRGAVPAGS